MGLRLSSRWLKTNTLGTVYRHKMRTLPHSELRAHNGRRARGIMGAKEPARRTGESFSIKSILDAEASIKLRLKNSNPSGLKFFSCNLIEQRGKKRERKKRGEEKRERRDALLITEPSAESWTAANSAGSWDRGMGEGAREKEG